MPIWKKALFSLNRHDKIFYNIDVSTISANLKSLFAVLPRNIKL